MLSIDPSIKNNEAYILDINSKQASLKAATLHGLFNGINTLDQLLLGDAENTSKRQIAAVTIKDTPRFPFRALMLDPARHFIPVEDVKLYIDQMAKYKFNALQLHLTDDQGWRIEIKKYPQLTAVGAFRDKSGSANGPHNGYYTQDNIREIVTYAQNKHIEVIPELDVPGHTVAAIVSIPEMGCTHMDTTNKVIGKTVDLMVCAGNEKVYQVYNTIFEEVAALFPSKQIHLGGDEAIIEKNWTKCARCTALQKELGYTKTSDLMGYFFKRLNEAVERNGKQLTLWCELDNIRMPANDFLFDYPTNATLVTWRHGLTPKCIELTRNAGHNLIMAPGEHAYFDYPQFKGDFPEFNNWGMPVLTLKDAYSLDPGYGLEDSQQKHITGVMGTLWGEAIQNIDRANYMTYPRGLALAEAGWTTMNNRSFDSFSKRIVPNLTDLSANGIWIRMPFELGKHNNN